MSFQAMAWAMKQPTTDCESTLLLLTLANFSNHNGESWPSLKRLADECRLSVRTIQRRLSQLALEEFITIKPRQSENGDPTSNLYVLNDTTTSQPDYTPPAPQAPPPTQPYRSDPISIEPEGLFPDCDEIPIVALRHRLGKIFHRRENTKWSDKELKALKVVFPIPTEDLEVVERFYSLKELPNNGFRRRDLCTLLNNWAGEVDRARAFRPPAPNTGY